MEEITREAADRIIEVALAKGRELKLKPLAVAVLDAGGHLKAYSREDGAAPGRFELARGKAYGAVMLGMSCRAQNERADAQSYFILAANGALGGGLIPVPGGVLVKGTEGGIIGAVGISGDVSDNDEACAVAGVEAAGLTPLP